MGLSYKKIQPLLVAQNSRLSKWFGYMGLGIGILLLLVSIQMFINIQKLLNENAPRKSGAYDFISISKTVTNDNMGKDNTFSKSDLLHLQQQPEVAKISPLIPNQFRVTATAGDIIPFSTDLFLESIDTEFLDTVPPSFKWSQGQMIIPIIFSSDFLEMYNVFAPAQGLPQLSAKTISSVNIFLECSGPLGTQTFRGNIVALSDRINSLLVPKNFINWANMRFSGDSSLHASRVYIKTKEANDPKLIAFLDQENYRVNKDRIRFSRIKDILQNIVASLGVFGIFVILMALMLFSFYLQLMIAKSKDNLRLLLLLGYSPKWLASSVAKNWLPVYTAIIISAIVLTQLLHLAFLQLPFVKKMALPAGLHWIVWATGLLLLFLTWLINTRLVRRELKAII
jgi:hypothetical protein